MQPLAQLEPSLRDCQPFLPLYTPSDFCRPLCLHSILTGHKQRMRRPKHHTSNNIIYYVLSSQTHTYISIIILTNPGVYTRAITYYYRAERRASQDTIELTKILTHCSRLDSSRHCDIEIHLLNLAEREQTRRGPRIYEYSDLLRVFHEINEGRERARDKTDFLLYSILERAHTIETKYVYTLASLRLPQSYVSPYQLSS